MEWALIDRLVSVLFSQLYLHIHSQCIQAIYFIHLYVPCMEIDRITLQKVSKNLRKMCSFSEAHCCEAN